MRKLLFVVLVLIMVVSVTGCFGVPDFSASTSTPIPVYDMEITEEDGMTINIAGVIYKELPKTKWDMHPEGAIDIGYGGSKEVKITAVQGDAVRNFIYVYTDRYDGGIYLRRTDIDVPEPSGDSVDEIIFSERDFSIKEGDDRKNTNFTYNHLTIMEFFDELQKNSDSVFSYEEVNNFGDTYFTIICRSDMVPSGSYRIKLGSISGKLVCGNKIDGYVEVSPETIEKLAGQEINFEQLMRATNY